jgi:hypothetical protein
MAERMTGLNVDSNIGTLTNLLFNQSAVLPLGQFVISTVIRIRCESLVHPNDDRMTFVRRQLRRSVQAAGGLSRNLL